MPPKSPGDYPAELTAFLAPAQGEDELGRLGGYRILKVLGHGGMGVVFQGEDPKLGRRVAIKAMLPHLAESKSAQQRFLREARAAAALEHDHIVPIFHVGEDRGAPFIVMPFLQGEPLDQRLERDGKLPVAEVLRIGRQTAQGLAAAHKKGLIHRDIKPANIWLEDHDSPLSPRGRGAGGEGFRVKILDFGLARPAMDNAQLTQQGAIIGTPAYMAPEQATGGAVDARCDLFSLGCVLYRMVTGQTPFKGTDTISTLMSVASDKPPAPREIDPDIPAGLSDLIMQLLAKHPEARSESAQAVVQALQEIETHSAPRTSRPARKPAKAPPGAGTGRTVQVPPTPAANKTRPSGKRRSSLAWWLAGGILGLGAAAAAIVLLWPTPRGLVKIESDDPNVEIVFDKNGPIVRGAGKEPIALRAGEHGIRIKRGDFEFEADKFVLQKGATLTLKLELLHGKIEVVQDGKVIATREVPRAPIFTNKLGMEFVLVPKGKSWLGGGKNKPGVKEVDIKEDFYLGKYEVTQEEWEKVMGNNPSYFSRPGAGGADKVKGISDADLKRFPVEFVTWDQAQLFVKALNQLDNEERWVYRLPTEAEWEYACRGGPMADKAESAFDFYFNKPANTLLPDQANFEHSTGLKRPCKVGSYKPNRLGLYDMHGNVMEWCEDVVGIDVAARKGACGAVRGAMTPTSAGPRAAASSPLRGAAWTARRTACAWPALVQARRL